MKWFEFKNFKDKTKLFFHGDIVGNSSEKWGDEDTCPQDVVTALNEAKGNTLEIHINSGGGNVFAGLAIYNLLKGYKGEKTVIVDGLAGSISSIIAMAGDKIEMPKNAFLVIHKPFVNFLGNDQEFLKMASDLQKIEDSLLDIYAENLTENVTREELKTMLFEETWLNYEKAKEIFKNVTAVSFEIKNYLPVGGFGKVPEEVKNQNINKEKELKVLAKLKLVSAFIFEKKEKTNEQKNERNFKQN